MIQTLDKTFKEIRTVIDTDTHKISVCRSLSEKGLHYYTILHMKDRNLQKRFLKIFSQHPMQSFDGDFIDIIAAESEVMAVFSYHKENPLFYYQALYCKQFADRLRVAKDLIAELMASKLPLEIQYLLLEDYNMNITPDNQVYFNYFLNMDLLPDDITSQDVVNKAAEVAFKILSDNLKTNSAELELFRLKTERKAYRSFVDIYSDLKKIPADIALALSFWGKISRFYNKEKSRIFYIAKLTILILLVSLSLFYSIKQWRNRSIATSQNTQDSNSEYKGLEKIGTVVLAPDESSTDETSSQK